MSCHSNLLLICDKTDSGSQCLVREQERRGKTNQGDRGSNLEESGKVDGWSSARGFREEELNRTDTNDESADLKGLVDLLAIQSAASILFVGSEGEEGERRKESGERRTRSDCAKACCMSVINLCSEAYSLKSFSLL